ncbi:response regulator [Pseudomonas sp. N040]|uniref:response regulator n=1 Tax=Pseudomonas sp. N040 TaxID=2785325 RepID=UPI0018A308B7|nr:response regulator transcription factor [Pseudomonas sp. N040]MBF7731669.1 response regulator transcription factor [Pseudomonas sp. N040]MBW7015313.1 response regulator transcription factor [Pseudomonas sp. N040]
MKAPNRINIVLADDHSVVRSGLRQFLDSTDDLKIVAEAATGKELLALLSKSIPDVVVLDISLPDLNGLELLKRIKRSQAGLPVLIFSMFSEDEFAVSAINAGAAGYLCKDSTPEQILTALRTVATGAHYVSPLLTEKLLRGSLGASKALPHEALSAREMSVMLLLSQGVALKQIGDQLFLSAKTVSTYRARILQKLGFHSNAEITRYVLEHKLG